MIVVGVDGGATSTKCLVVDEQGHVLGTGRGGPSNHVYGEKGFRRLKEALEAAFRAAFGGKSRPRVQSICLGMTGATKGTQSAQIVEAVTRTLLEVKHVYVCNDLEIAWVGATLGQPGVVVYAGTGAHTLGIDETGVTVHVGGWGYLIDDEGAGYDIGRQALKWAFRAQDGRGKPTVLVEKLKAHFGCSSLAEVRKKVYLDDGLSRPEVAALARLVGEAAEEGDEVAREILARAGRTLAETAIVAIKKLGREDAPPPVYPAGGVFRAGKWILEPFVHSLRQSIPQVEVRTPAFPPVAGAVFLAMKPLKIALTQAFLENLSRDLEGIEWII